MANEEQESLDLLIEKMKGVSDDKLNDTFIGALKLTLEQKNLINFVFWFCYMVETDLDNIIKMSWKLSSESFPSSPEVEKIVKKMFTDRIKGFAEEGADINILLSNLAIDTEKKQKILEFLEKNYSPKRVFTSVEDLPYFIDKIKVCEAFFGKTERIKMFYKINNIRNALSHNKIDELEYDGQNLLLRATKEKIIEDFFTNLLEDDLSKSEIWNSLTPEQIKEVEEARKSLPHITDLESFRKMAK